MKKKPIGYAPTLGELVKVLVTLIAERPEAEGWKWNGYDDESLVIQLPDGVSWEFISNDHNGTLN